MTPHENLQIAMLARYHLLHHASDESTLTRISQRFPWVSQAQGQIGLLSAKRMMFSAIAANSGQSGSGLLSYGPPDMGGASTITAEGTVSVVNASGVEIYKTLRLKLPWNITLEEYRGRASAGMAAMIVKYPIIGGASDVRVELTSMWIGG